MNKEEFIQNVKNIGIDIDDKKMEMLEKYYDLLIGWNEKINLTAITKKEDVYLKHFYDSLTIVKVIDLNKENTFCDIGSGAGFPGLVIKIFFPHLKITLIDSLNKRINFLNEVIKELNLANIEAIHARAEEYALSNREKFDVVTARAVSSISTLLEFSMPLLKLNKYFIAMRGQDESGYEKALDILGGKVIKKEEFNLPFEQSKRTLIKVEKIRKTNLKYPRKFSEIKKNPI